MRNIIGKSVEGRDLVLHANFPLRGKIGADASRKSTLLIGGTHGDERATVAILDNFTASHLDSGRIAEPTAVLSLHNPDGHAADSRYNARGVDLNRNFGHNWNPVSDEPPGRAPLSEPETQAIHAFILARRPAKIVSLHWALSEIDADGPQSTALAARMWEALGEEQRKPYRLRVHRPEKPEAGFCPGSLGQWCGNGLVYPDGTRPAMVTLELPYHAHVFSRPEPLPADHLERIRETWRTRPEAYLTGVQEAVHRMLEAACRLQHVWPRPADAAG
jgi:hypothetical protein